MGETVRFKVLREGFLKGGHRDKVLGTTVATPGRHMI